tara:strand:+ start:620 stop:1495 length:876 start_codon:yes stop_codon:yes gene_type:complete
MCPHGVMDRPKGFMEVDFFKKIVDEIREFSEFIFLHGIGESLLHTNLVECINYAGEKGLTTALSTNICYLDEKLGRDILESNLNFITLALDGGTKETYESIRVKGDFNQVLSNIKQFLRLKNETRSKVDVTLQLILMRNNWHESKLFENLFSEEEKKAVNHFRFKPFWDNFVRSDHSIQHDRACFYLWNMMSIFWDGQVPLCCVDYDNQWNLGDLKKHSVKEIWNSAWVKKARDSHSKSKLSDYSICDTCSVPNQEYFSPFNVFASAFLGSKRIRKILPIYEKYFIKKPFN